MKKREIQKKATKSLLLKTAKEVFTKKGFLNTTTAEIAKKTNVAHGTLFLHFKNKETLIIEIFQQELIKMTDELHNLLNNSYDIKILLDRYLTYLIKEEDFFSTIAKELPFYQDDLKRQIFFRESGTRSYFIEALEKGIKQNNASLESILIIFGKGIIWNTENT